MTILTKKDLTEVVAGQIVRGTALIKSYTQGVTKTQKPFLDGVLCGGIDVNFKVWDGVDGLLSFIVSNELEGKICDVVLEAQNYLGSISFIMKNCTLSNSGYELSDFLETRVDANAYLDVIMKFLNKVLSQEGYALADEILFSNEELLDRFKFEFCAKSHHDNYKSGLMVHTYKCLDMMNFMLTRYPAILNTENRPMKVVSYQSDLYYIGMLLHDIGKVFEMKMGVYQPNTATTHRYLGTEVLAKYKDSIISVYDEKWYYDLVAILLQHHGEYGDPCTTLCSMIAHIVDFNESRMTSICESLQGKVTIEKAGSYIKYDGKRLFL